MLLAQKTWTGFQGRVAEGRGWTRCSWAEWLEIAQGQCRECSKAMILLGKSPNFGLIAHTSTPERYFQVGYRSVLGRFDAIPQDGGIAYLIGQQQNQAHVQLLRRFSAEAFMGIE